MLLLTFFLLFCCECSCSSLRKRQISIEQPNPTINVHIFMHSHQDPNWIATFDEYFNGYKFWSAKSTYDQAFSALMKNSSRNFNVVEISWFDQISLADQVNVMLLIKNGQFNFIGGGICMSDEAVAYYEDQISNVRLGHKWLQDNFDLIPKIGWQIDPFGHSRGEAFLMKKFGMQGWFFERIDYLQKNSFAEKQQLEFLWNTVNNMSIFSHIIYYHYGEFKELPNTELDINELERLAKNLTEEAQMYRFNELVRLVGDDFAVYSPADYEKLEAIMEFFNQNPKYGIKMLYSTPQQYLQTIHQISEGKQIALPQYSKDFFPYKDKPFSYWSGYFGTKTNQKYLLKQVGKFFRNVASLMTILDFRSFQTENEEIANASRKGFQALDELEFQVALGNHHDTITGTSSQKVDEYFKCNVDKSLKETDKQLRNYLKLYFPQYFNSKNNIDICKYETNSSCKLNFNFMNGTKLILFIFNPGQNRTEHIQLQIPPVQLKITTDNQQDVRFDIICNEFENSYCDLFIFSSFNALDFKTFIIEVIDESISEQQESKFINFNQQKSKEFQLFNSQNFKLYPDGQYFVQTLLANNQINSFSLDYKYYESFATEKGIDQQMGGAYIMRLKNYIQNSLDLFLIFTIIFLLRVSNIQRMQYFQGEHTFMLLIKRAEILTKIILFFNTPLIEIQTQFKSETFYEMGREYIIKIKAENVKNNNYFYTDSLGLMTEERKLKGLNPAKNFYPATSFAYIKDNQTQMNVVIDRAQGVSSLQEGELEFMFAREIKSNDYRGMFDIIFKLESMQLKHQLFFTNPSQNQELRQKQLRQDQPLLPIVGQLNQIPENQQQFTNSQIIQNSQLLIKYVFKKINRTHIELYMHNMNEEQSYDLPIDLQNKTINHELQKLLQENSIEIDSIDEYDLSFTQLLSQEQELSWKKMPKQQNFSTVILPMDIRSFIIKIKEKE